MTHRFPLRRSIKSYAKKLMMNPLCLRATLMLVCMTVGLFGIRTVTGANLTMGLVNLADYADTATGFYRNSEGFSLIFRMDLTQMVLAIPVSYEQLIRFAIMMVVTFLVLSPLRLGAMEQYWSALRGDQQQLLNVTPAGFTPALSSAAATAFLMPLLVMVAPATASTSMFCFSTMRAGTEAMAASLMTSVSS